MCQIVNIVSLLCDAQDFRVGCNRRVVIRRAKPRGCFRGSCLIALSLKVRLLFGGGRDGLGQGHGPRQVVTEQVACSVEECAGIVNGAQ